MSERPIDEAAIRQVVRDLDGPVGEAYEIMDALALAVRSLATPSEKRGLLFLALELEQRVEKIHQCFDRAWPAVGFEGGTR